MSPSIGAISVEVKVASMDVTDGLDGSLEQAKVMTSPFLFHA